MSNYEWDENAESDFAQFIRVLGKGRAEGKCKKLGECLQNPNVNIYFAPEDQNLDLFADCADLPMILRAYFAFKTKRPFSWVGAIHGDRYELGNKPKYFFNQLEVPTLTKLFSFISSSFHTGMFRMAPDVEDSDTYPIKVSKESLKPGTLFYDPNGHVLLVYEIAKDGSVLMLDGHPDNSLTVQTFSSKYVRGRAVTGGGFRNFRPLIQSGSDVIRVKNEWLPYFSASDQYQKSYKVGGTLVTYYEWVKAKLSGATDIKYDPLKQIFEKTIGLCGEISERIKSVNAALAREIHLKPHPELLPENIFGAEGEWESFSTPGRDARLKASFREVFAYVKKISALKKNGSSSVKYQGSFENMILDMHAQFERAISSPACKFEYQKSDRRFQRLTFENVENRLFDLSFDPYHCPELRWGALQDSSEFESCRDDQIKIDWYNLESRLRNIIDRDLTKPTTLDTGPELPEEVRVSWLLKSIVQELDSAPTPGDFPKHEPKRGSICYPIREGVELYKLPIKSDLNIKTFLNTETRLKIKRRSLDFFKVTSAQGRGWVLGDDLNCQFESGEALL